MNKKYNTDRLYNTKIYSHVGNYNAYLAPNDTSCEEGT